MDPYLLITKASEAMMLRMGVTLTLPADWTRPENFPLPIERKKPDADGVVTQDYRPLAIFEWCEYKLAEPERQAVAAARIAARAAKGGFALEDGE